MALSLKCGQCGLQLRSVKEAQDHGEASGHSQFEESTEAVLTLVCSECGKPCRSETEQDIHTKRTGHASFVDKTNEAAKPMDSESEMKKLKQELKEGDAMEVDAPVKEGEASADAGPDEMIAPEVDGEMVKQLGEMGFNVNRATRAIYNTGSNSLEVCVNWIMEHEKDTDIDDEFLVAKKTLKPPKKKLTPEEARIQAEQLRKAATAKREKEEKESARLREQERIRSGKELVQAKRIEEDQERRRIIELRKREKEEEARAMDRIKQRLEEDKRERRRKLGLPEELTPAEVEAEKEKERLKAAAAAAAIEAKAKAGIVVQPIGLIQQCRAALVEMKKAHGADGDKFAVACKTLLAYVGNAAQAPAEEKFRKIRLGNPAFQQRVGSLTGGLAFLEHVGFERDAAGEFMVIPMDKASNTVAMNAAGAELNNAMSNPFFGVL